MIDRKIRLMTCHRSSTLSNFFEISKFVELNSLRIKLSDLELRTLELMLLEVSERLVSKLNVDKTNSWFENGHGTTVELVLS